MTSVADLRDSGETDVIIPTRHLPEPLSGPISLQERLARFPEEIYSATRDSHLYRYLQALAGDAGAGILKRELLYPRLQQMIGNTHFGDLDRLYGSPLGLSRLTSLNSVGVPLETYSANPETEALTNQEWIQIRLRDAHYRARCLLWMRAIIKGPTLEGMALAAEAATGIEADVFEQYRQLDNLASDDVIAMPHPPGVTSSRSEFVIIPRTPELTQDEHRRIVRLVDLLRPTDTVVTVYSGDRIRQERAVIRTDATSTGFTVTRKVTGRADSEWASTTGSDSKVQCNWLISGQAMEAPTFAFMERQETAVYLDLSTVTASTYHVGFFSANQTAFFSHLALVDDPFAIFSGDRAIAHNAVQLNFTTPWMTRG